MTDYGITRSMVEPEAIEITETMVYVSTNIHQIQVDIEGDVHTEYEFNLQGYEKDEYIKMMKEQNDALEEDLTSTQLALVDVYEMIGE